MRGKRFAPKIKRGFYSQAARRVDVRHMNAQAKRARGAGKVITISTHENSPEFQLWNSMGKKTTKSKEMREFIRRAMVAESEDADSMMIHMRKQIEELTLRSQRQQGREHILRHALGYHFEGVVPECETCRMWGAI
jgi:hypothetical protein